MKIEYSMALSLRFHGVLVTTKALRSHGVVGDLTALLLRLYGASTALLLERGGTAFVLCMLKTNAVPWRSVAFYAIQLSSHDVTCDRTALTSAFYNLQNSAGAP